MTPDQDGRGAAREGAEAARQIERALNCGDLRTCQDCGAKVPYLFSPREYVTYATRCGKDTFEPRICPDGYVNDRGPYAAGTLEAMTDARLMVEMDRAYGLQAGVVDSGGSDDAAHRAEDRCKHVEQELEARGLNGTYWARREPIPTPTGEDGAVPHLTDGGRR